MSVHRKIFKTPWHYILGGVILAMLNILLLVVTGDPWRVTGGLFYWGLWMMNQLGVIGDTSLIEFYDRLNVGETLLVNTVSLMNIGVILGAMFSAFYSGEFKIRKIKNKKQLVAGVLGGVMMGYGARISFGCNIGSLFGGVPSYSLHGWLFWFFMAVGAYIGSKILMKYLL